MLFQTNTTISLIASVLTYLTKNTLCGNQQTDDQNNRELQVSNSENSSQSDESEDSKRFLATEMNESTIKYLESVAEIHKKKYADCKIFGTLTKREEAVNEFILILNEITLAKVRGIIKLVTNFTKENYEELLDNIDDSIIKIKNFKSGYSSVMLEKDNKKVSGYIEEIKQVQQIPEISENFFTACIDDKKEKEKIIKTIKRVNTFRNNKRLLKKALVF